MKGQGPNPRDNKAEFVRSVFAEYGADLHQFLLRRLKNDQDAKDLAQEVYLRMLRFGRSELIRQPHAYVFHIACQVVGQFRLKSRQNPVTYDSEAAHEQAERSAEVHRDELLEQLSAQRQLQRLLAELAALPATHRKIIVMRRWEGASRAQIAAKLKLSEHTVKKYIAEANSKLGMALWSE